MAPTRNIQSGNDSSRKLFMEGSTSINQERKAISNYKMIQHTFMEEILLNNFKTYVHICQGFLREFFTKVLNQVFLNIVKDFYSNLEFEDISLNSSVEGIEIDIHSDHFG